MKILAFCTSHWDNDPKLADSKAPELNDWANRVGDYFQPEGLIIATGCQDRPELNPLMGRAIHVPSGEPKSKPYDTYRYSYFLCAFEAALWYTMSLEPSEFDLLVEMESNCWINPRVNLAVLLDDFMERRELILAPSWYSRPDFNLLVMKPAAIPRFLHHRLRGNIVEEPLPLPMLPEDELGQIFKDKWYNPWPEVDMVRQQWGIPENPPHWRVTPDEIAKDWPAVALPSPEIQKLFTSS